MKDNEIYRSIMPDKSVEAVAAGANHRAAKLVQPGPGRLIASQAQILLKTFGARSILLAGDPPHGPKPHQKRLPSPLKDGSRCHRDLASTLRTAKQQPPRPPRLPAITRRTDEPVRPAHLNQVLHAGLFRRKPRFEFHKRPRIIFHAPILYIGVRNRDQVVEPRPRRWSSLRWRKTGGNSGAREWRL